MHRYRKFQDGVSLISLMVGVTISMIVILAVMVVYKTTVSNGAIAGQAAISDGERMVALLSEASLMQEAGFGIDSAEYGTDLLVISDAAIGTTEVDETSENNGKGNSNSDSNGNGNSNGNSNGNGNSNNEQKLTGTVVNVLPATGRAVVWGSKINGTYMCQGLYATASGGLIRLPAQQCSSVKSWATLNWNPMTIVKDTDSTHLFSITVAASTQADGCKVFGITGGGALLVTLTTTNSTDLATTATICLSNFPI